MRYFFLIVSGVLLVLMLVVFFQNYSAGTPTEVFAAYAADHGRDGLAP